MLCLFQLSIRVLHRFLQFAVLSATNAAALQLVSSFQPKTLLLQFARFCFFFFPAKKRCCCKFARFFFQPKRCLQFCSVQPNAVFLVFFPSFVVVRRAGGPSLFFLRKDTPLLLAPRVRCLFPLSVILVVVFSVLPIFLDCSRFSLVFCWCLRHGDRVTLVNTLCTCTGNTR